MCLGLGVTPYEMLCQANVNIGDTSPIEILDDLPDDDSFKRDVLTLLQERSRLPNPRLDGPTEPTSLFVGQREAQFI